MPDVVEPWSLDDREGLKTLLAKLRQTYNVNDQQLLPPPEPPKKTWIDHTFSAQALIAGLFTVLVSGGVWFFNTSVGYQQFQHQFTENTETTRSQVDQIKKDIGSLNDQMNIFRQANIQLRDQLARWQADSTAANLDQQRSLASLDKNIAIMQERMDERFTRPRGDNAPGVAEKYGSLQGVPSNANR